MPVSFTEVRKIALSLDNVVESTSYGTAAFKIKEKLIARLREVGESLVVETTFEEREELFAAVPNTYCITDHYLKYPWVLVRLSEAASDALRGLLIRATKLAAAAMRKSASRV